MQQEMKPRDDLSQDPKKTVAVLVIQEDGLPGMAPRGDVVESANKFDTEGAGHETTLPDKHA